MQPKEFPLYVRPLGPITSSGGGSSSKALSPGTPTAVLPAKALLWTTFDSPLVDARSSTRCPSRRIVADHTARRPRLEAGRDTPALKQQQHCKYSKYSSEVSKYPVRVHRPGRAAALKSNGPMSGHDIEGLQSDRVQVAVRVRPASLSEKCGQYKAMVKVTGENVLCFDPDQTEDGHVITPTTGDSDRRRRVGQRRCKNLRFAYDHVFDADCGTECVFEKTTRPLIDFVCSGYAATVFAYGATGSGKTHTMLGSAASGPGVMPLAIEALFDAMSKQDEEHTFSLRLSYLEVYNECIRDLLAPNTGEPMTPALAAGAGEDSAATVRRTKPFKRKDHGLALRHDAKSGVSVVGLSEHEPAHAGEVFEMLERGNARRAVSETAANAQSSRSHAVLQISLRRASRAAGVNDAHQLGKLSSRSAGSERGSVSRNRGQTLHEAPTSTAACWRSATASTRCRSPRKSPVSRTSPTATQAHPPPAVLLSGDTKTVMIATVSPAPGCTEDTHNTLKYAHRAKAIQVQATSKTVNVEYHVSRYQAIIASLQSEVAHWKAKASGEGIPRSPAGMLPSLRGSFALPAAGENEGMGLSDEGAQLFAAIDARHGG